MNHTLLKSRLAGQIALSILYFTSCLFLNGATQVFAQQTTYSKVKIHLDAQHSLESLTTLGITLDHTGDHGHGHQHTGKTHSIEAELSDSEIAMLNNAGAKYEILIPDLTTFYAARAAKELQNNTANFLKNPSESGLGCDEPLYATPQAFNLGSMGGFLTLAELLAELDQMTALYPNLITLKQSASSGIVTPEGRFVYYLKISDNPNIDEAEPEVLYTALHHAREPMSMMQMVFYMWYLLENYGSDNAIKDLVDNTEMYFIPCINPDGYVYNQINAPNGGGLWRKNRRNNGDGTYGVDLNRNYAYNWGLSTNGSSPLPSSGIYRGTAPFSEPETQIVRNFCEAHEFAIALNYHAYGSLLVYPWGYELNAYTPDHDLYLATCERQSWYNRYLYGTANETVAYLVNGDSDDWMYGEQTTKNKILALTPEVGRSIDGFYPLPSRIVPLCRENVWSNLQAAYTAGNYAIVKDATVPYLNALSGDLDITVKKLGMGSGETYTATVVPISTNLTNVGNPVVITGLGTLQEQNVTFSYVIDPAILVGDMVEYYVEIDNGDYVLTSDVISKIYNPNIVFFDDISNSLNWSTDTWALTNEAGHTSNISLTDSPFINYSHMTSEETVLQNPIDLTGANTATLSFWAKWEIEQNKDWAQVLVSIDEGTTWTALCGNYTKMSSTHQDINQPIYDGYQAEWVQEQISLDDYTGNHILLKFRNESNGNRSFDGFYLDDITVQKALIAAPNPVYIQLMLEGAYVSSPLMSTHLSDNQLISLGQPYSSTPWNYTGNENLISYEQMPENVVDWLLIEARDATDNQIVISTTAALLRNDGMVINTDGTEGVTLHIIPGNDYYLTVRHRNHLAVISSTAITLPNAGTPYDFTISATQALGEAQQVALAPNLFALRAGDISGDGVITVTDFNTYSTQAALLNVYIQSDCNLNGTVTVSDFNLYLPNGGLIGVEQVRY